MREHFRQVITTSHIGRADFLKELDEIARNGGDIISILKSHDYKSHDRGKESVLYTVYEVFYKIDQ